MKVVLHVKLNNKIWRSFALREMPSCFFQRICTVHVFLECDRASYRVQRGFHV
jgi:hypothetical protein